jgi:hypothetical protein
MQRQIGASGASGHAGIVRNRRELHQLIKADSPPPYPSCWTAISAALKKSPERPAAVGAVDQPAFRAQLAGAMPV